MEPLKGGHQGSTLGRAGANCRRRDGNELIVILIIGLISGWLAGQIMKGSGYGLIGDVTVGVIGAFIGGWLWGALHLPVPGPWWLTAIVSAVFGACILLFILRLIKR
jgi:uncharacterized membrane protein YeaQ/YmgE (transglycosylase-associated protein family)